MNDDFILGYLCGVYLTGGVLLLILGLLGFLS